MVVLTDLEYLVLGATRWVGRRVGRGWVKPGAGRGGYYANRDLWEVSVERMEELRDRGCEVSFWLVKRGERGVGLLGEAKEAAREAVGRGDGGGGGGAYEGLCFYALGGRLWVRSHGQRLKGRRRRETRRVRLVRSFLSRWRPCTGLAAAPASYRSLAARGNRKLCHLLPG